MKTTLVLLSFSCILGINSLGAAAGMEKSEMRIYQEKTEGKIVDKTYYTEQNNEGYLWKILNPKGQMTIQVTHDYQTVNVLYQLAGQTNRSSMQRRENKIVFLEKAGDKVIRKKEISIENPVWYSSFMQLRAFVLSEATRQEFFKESIKKWKMMKLVAIKEKKEKIMLAENEYATLKVKVTFRDYRALFWSCYLWFRESDGILIKSSEIRGKPGTPETTEELIKE